MIVAICCLSKELKLVVQSSLTAETRVQRWLYIWKNSLKELCNTNLQVEIYTVNQSLSDALISSKNVNEKRLRMDMAALKEYISTDEITEIKWIKLSDQLADKSTKQSANPPHLINALGDDFK